MKRITCSLAILAVTLSTHAQEAPSDSYSKTLAKTMVLTADAERMRVEKQIAQLTPAAAVNSPAPSSVASVSTRAEEPSPRVTGSFGQDGERYFSVSLPDGNTDIARRAGQVLKGGEWRVAAVGPSGPTFTKATKVQANGTH